MKWSKHKIATNKIFFSQTVIKELNRLGMIIDLSHSSRKTSRDTMEASEAPVIFSHSSAFALCNSTRNVRDDTLKMVVSINIFWIVESGIFIHYTIIYWNYISIALSFWWYILFITKHVNIFPSFRIPICIPMS